MSIISRLGRTALGIGIGLAILAAAIVLHRFALMPLLEGAFEWDESAFTQTRRISLTALFIVAYAVGMRLTLRQWPSDLKVKPMVWVISGLGGAVTIGLQMIVIWATGFYEITDVGSGELFPLLSLAVFIFAAALLEEIVFRGILFGTIERYFGTIIAIIIPSVLFSVLHIFNDNWSGWLPIVSGAFIGVFWTLIYIVTRNLWAVALNHACWNFTIVLSGLPLTGQQGWRSIAPIQSEPSGPVWWSGGDAGPENTVLCVLVLVLVSGVLWRWAIRQGAFKGSGGTAHTTSSVSPQV